MAYDVTNRIKAGQNGLGLILADGWYSRPLMHGRLAGYQPLGSAFLELTGATGKVTSDGQTAYLLALAFNLVPEELKDKTVAHLVRAFTEKNDHLAPGFLGTSLVTAVFSENGHADLAYRVLLQETGLGWLSSVKNGAPTIWERWDSWTRNEAFIPKA